MKVRFPIFLSLAFLSGAFDHASAVEFQFGNFTCDDLGATISIIDYPNDAAGPVVIPQSIERGGIQKPVTVIEELAFNDAGMITSVTIPTSVLTIGFEAFARCSTLASITLPSSLTSIGSNVFAGCTALTSVTMPSSLTSIESETFAGCTALTSVTLPSSLVSIGASAFSGCISLASITLPAGLTTIEESLFQGCSSLTSLLIPVGVTTIGQKAFAECSGLVRMAIPFGVTTIGVSAFDNCDSLTNVTIPTSITSIETYAFFGCDSLTNVTIPSSVSTIGRGAFSDVSLLKYIFFMGNSPSMGDSVFDNLGANPNLRIYIFSGKAGFTLPTVPRVPVPPISQYWQPLEGQPDFVYACINMGPENPMIPWLILNSLPTNSNPQDDANGDGVNLLMAYALNLDPSKNLSSRLPQPVFGNNQMSMSFYAGSPGITYRVETCTDLMSWTDVGVTLSLPNSLQVITASVDLSGSQRFMRLVVEK